MRPYSVEEIANAVSGKILFGADVKSEITAVDLDSRKINEGSLFIPIVGERFDAHNFIKDALNSGAAGCLVSKDVDEFVPGKFYIKVPDTRLALKSLAMAVRNEYDIPIIAVVGSVGKTTTKDMIYSVLSQKYSVLKTDGNLNNDIGLPQMIIKLDDTYDFAVLEMGMNHFGEIAYLSEIVYPDVVVMTNIGDAHIENLGSRKNILKAKAEVFEYISPSAFVLINGDDELLCTLRKSIPCRLVGCGESEDCEAKITEISTAQGQVSFKATFFDNTFNGTVNEPGRHLVYPAVMSSILGHIAGLSDDEIKAGLDSFSNSKMRMNVRQTKSKAVLLDDTYNANPQSVCAALDILADWDCKKRVAVLGDMLELGKYAEKKHTDIGIYAESKGIDVILSFGENAKAICQGTNIAKHFEDREELKKELGKLLDDDTAVLVKASRGMQFEEFSDFIEKYDVPER